MIFFITFFRYFTVVLFFTLHFFSFSQGMQTRERAHCARSVFPFIKKKKKKIFRDNAINPFSPFPFYIQSIHSPSKSLSSQHLHMAIPF